MQNENSAELYHYGKLGMKWGRHVYKDRYGGLKSAGKQRVRDLTDEHKKLSSITKLTKKGEKRLSDVQKEYEHLTGKTIGDHVSERVGIKTPKRIDEMTNEELSAYNARKALENTYLGYQPKHQSSRGKQFVSYVGSKVIAPIATDIGKKWMTGYAIARMNGVDNPAKYASKTLMAKGKSTDKDKDKSGD